MAQSIKTDRPQPTRLYANSSGGSIVDPIDTYAPPWETSSATKVLAMALTPSGTSVTIDPTATDAVSVTTGTMRLQIAIGAHTLTGAYYFRAFARRKPGTTGAIVAQEITFTINSVQVGKFTVAAADASTDPISGSIELVQPTLDTRFNLTSYNLVIGATASDADLEIVFEIVGA